MRQITSNSYIQMVSLLRYGVLKIHVSSTQSTQLYGAHRASMNLLPGTIKNSIKNLRSARFARGTQGTQGTQLTLM